MFVTAQQKNAVRQEYDRLADEYDRRWQRYIDATMKAVLEVVKFEGREKILDIPCGTGALERRLLEKWPNLRITGADISPGMLRQAKSKEADAKVKWVNAEVSRLPFVDGEFDCVICANSFHYFSTPEESLEEIRRVLRPEGMLILVDWCDDYLTCKLCSVWLRWTDSAFHRTYSLQSCMSMAVQTGFEVERSNRFRVNWLWGMMRLVCRRTE